MHKKLKIFILLFFFFIFISIFQNVFAKYIIEDTIMVAKLDIDCLAPNIELISISNSNTPYPSYANKTHIITGILKLTEKNIVKNNLNSNNIQFLVNNSPITPQFRYFSLISQNSSEKIYEFSITNLTNDGNLNIVIPEGIVEDKSDLINSKKVFSTNIIIDNTAPTATLKETSTSNNKSIAEVSCNEPIQKLSGWDFSNSDKTLSKEFPNKIKYNLPLVDYAQNSSYALIDIKNATNINLEYGTYDEYSKQTIVSCGEVSAPNTINSGSICKAETIFARIDGGIDLSKLLARCYVYTYWGEGSNGTCAYSELPYSYGYNPSSASEWINYSTSSLMYYGKRFIQLGGRNLNRKNATNRNTTKGGIPENIAKQYLYGISGVQFKLANASDYSIVYQCYVKDIGWLKASSDGEENLYRHDKPITAIRMNIVPKSEKQYLINYLNVDSHL